MVKYKNEVLNVVFAALADPTLRTVPQTLEQGSLSVWGSWPPRMACRCPAS